MRLILVPICMIGALLSSCDGDTVRISSTTTTNGSDRVMKVIDALQCPETIGVLTRKGSAQSGGDVCVYSGPRGAEVSLHMIKLENEAAEAVLDRFQKALAGDMPHTSAELRVSADAAEGRKAADAAQRDANAAQVQADAAQVSADAVANSANLRERGMAIDTRGDRATIRLPGMSVDADGDKASVRIGGFSINADDSSQTVNVASSDESVSVQAHNDAAEIRTRGPGEAVRTTYMLRDGTPANEGWRLVGYEARGPVGGPIVIATVRSKDRDSDDIFDSAKDLVTLNVGE